jgi:hypothetical protein
MSVCRRGTAGSGKAVEPFSGLPSWKLKCNNLIMVVPQEPLTLTPEQIQEVERRLSELRHNINNNLSLIVAATELIRRKPEMASRMAESIAEQPPKVLNELRSFSDDLESLLRIVRHSK